MQALFFVFAFICVLLSGCNPGNDPEAPPVAMTDAFYFPNAKFVSEGFDIAYSTIENFQFVVPKEWLMVQSTELRSLNDEGRQLQIPNSLEPKVEGAVSESEVIMIARQFNLIDPTLVVTLSLTRKTDSDRQTQQRLSDDLHQFHLLNDTEQFRNHVLGPLEGKPGLKDYSWIDGGARRYGDWLCLFHEVEMDWANGTEHIYSLVTCPAGSRSIRIALLISPDNADAVRDQVSRFVASMDVSSTDWAVD